MKKIIVAAVLLFLSVNLFPLIPWEVTIYRGEYVRIVQSPGKTELLMSPRDRDPSEDTEDREWAPDTGEDVDSLLNRLFTEGDALSAAGINQASRTVMPRLDKVYVPVLFDGDARLVSVSWGSDYMLYEFASEATGASRNDMVFVCGGGDCQNCALYESRFSDMADSGETDQVLDLGAVKAVLSDAYMRAFGEKNGVKFHAHITVPEGTGAEEALRAIDFKTYYPGHAALTLYRLAEAGRILSVALFVTGGVLLVLGLLPQRKNKPSRTADSSAQCREVL